MLHQKNPKNRTTASNDLNPVHLYFVEEVFGFNNEVEVLILKIFKQQCQMVKLSKY